MKDNLECKIYNNITINMIKKIILIYLFNNNIILIKNNMIKIKLIKNILRMM